MKVFIYNFPVSYRKRLESDLRKIRKGLKISFLKDQTGLRKIVVKSLIKDLNKSIMEEMAFIDRIPNYWKFTKIGGSIKKFCKIISGNEEEYRKQQIQKYKEMKTDRRALARR